MKTVITRFITRTKLPLAVLIIAVIAIAGFSSQHSSYAASGGLAFSPSSGSYNVGDTFNVAVQESGTAATTVQATVQFPSSLQFVSDTTVAPFSFNPNGNDTANNNSITITRSQLGGSSTGTVTTITFKVLSAGSAALSFAASPNSYILPPGVTSISGSALTIASSASFTLNTPSAPAPAPAPTPAPAPAPTPAPAPVTTNPKGTSINVAPKGSGSGSGSSGGGSTTSAVTVPDNGSVAVSTPVTVEPTTIQSDGVKKIAYYLGGKLVDTETKPPYKYNINTAKLKNGSYNLVSKTYYTNGTTKEATQHLVVKNAAAHTKSSLWLYFLAIGLVILIVLGINFVGPSTGDPFRKLFKRYTLPPLSPDANGNGPDVDIHAGPLPPVPGAPTVIMPGSSAGEVAPPAHDGHVLSVKPDTPAAGQPGNTAIHHLQPPERPAPGTVFPPSKDS